MTRPLALSKSAILAELCSPISSGNQVEALRALKNDIVGHEQRKETWVELGVIRHLGAILHACDAAPHRVDRGGRIADSKSASHASLSDETCLQAIITVGSLAYGASRLRLSRMGLTGRQAGPDIYLLWTPATFFPLFFLS